MGIGLWQLFMGGFTGLLGFAVAVMGWMVRRQVERIDHLETRERDLADKHQVAESLALERAERLVALEARNQQHEVELAIQGTAAKSLVSLEELRGVIREELKPLRDDVTQHNRRLTLLESRRTPKKTV